MTKKNLFKHSRFSKSKLAIAMHMLFFGDAFAAPVGGEIVGGSGSIAQHGAETTIVQESERLAVDWQAFDVGKNERVEFVQPGKSAVALNRILGNKGSEILGRIDANGHVILVNPRGVVFGESATVNGGGLIASGLQINPDDFMNGDLVFKRIEGTDGTVINSGMINAASGGNVALVGTRVENRGLISATLGSVILASGKEAVLTFDESGLLGVQIDKAVLQDELHGSTAVLNAGEIRAESGRILLSASTTRDVFSQAVNWGEQKQARSVAYDDDGGFTLSAGGDVVNSGSINTSGEVGAGKIIVLGENITHSGAIKANANQGRGGNVELHSTTTTKLVGEALVTANAEQGGDIKLLGKNVGLFDQSAVAAIGENGGGRILLGGDREGLNSQVRNADFSYVSEKSNVDVSAAHSGNGGTVIIYAEDTSRVHGSLSAKGGAKAGDGGFIETSGKRGFLSVSTPDVSAANGRSGHWLIDPFDITIVSDGEEINADGEFTSVSGGSRVRVGSIQTVLNTGGNVTLKTGGDEGDITVSSNITVNPMVDATLNLIAHRDIIFDANIQANGANSLHLNLNANRSGATGGIRFRGTRTINTSGGDFKIGYINEDGSIDTSMPGAYDADFSNVTIDVTGPSYEDLGTLNTHFGGRSINGDRDQHLKNSGRIVVNASHDVNLGGSDPNNTPNSDNGDVTMIVRGREQDRMSVDEDAAEKIHIIAGNDIRLDNGRVWTYDNNPTENPRSGSDGSPYDGFTTLKLQAGNDIDLQGNIIYAWNQQAESGAGQEHNDRLMIDFSAGGNISVDGNILTAGGDFFVQKAVNVNFSGQTVNTHSRYGAGSVSIAATGEVTLGNMPMFAQDVSGVDGNAIRTPSLKISAGTLSLISDLYTQGGGIALEAEQLNLNEHRLETGTRITEEGEQRGDIRLATAEDLRLSDIFSAGNITLTSKEGAGAFTITNEDQQFELNGDLMLVLDKGSADLAGVVNNADGETIHLTIGSGQNVKLQTDQAIRLSNSKLSGDLALTSGSNITQQENTHLDVAGSSTFSVGEGRIVLDQDNNIFGSFEDDTFTAGAIWLDGEDATEVIITSAQDLLLGRVDSEMTLGGSLELNSAKSINQSGLWSVAGETTLSAGGNIVLDNDNNAFTTLGILKAQSVTIHNSRSLELASIENVQTLGLSVNGLLTQSAALSVDNLTLSKPVEVDLQQENRIGNLSGGVLSGVITATGPLVFGNITIGDAGSAQTDESFRLTLSGENAAIAQADDSALSVHLDASIDAPEVLLNKNINISDNTSLTFNQVDTFTLSGNIQGAGTSKVVVNGGDIGGTFTVADEALWQDVDITLNGGDGDDTLTGPNLEVNWNLGESFELETGPADNSRVLAFSSMETLQGGSGVDEFKFSNGTIPNLSLFGGDGDDVADYSGTAGAIQVSLGDVAGLREIELIRGNNNGEGTNNSALIAHGNIDQTWTISAVNSGEVTPDGGTPIVFKDFNQLHGGTGKDHFILQADLQGGAARVDGAGGADIFEVMAEITASLLGGEGADQFNLEATTVGGLFGDNGDDVFALTASSQVTALDGGDGHNTLLGFDAALLWGIGGVENAVVIDVSDGTTNFVAQASNIAALQGSDSDDTFTFSVADSGVGVDGGKGVNTADFSGIATHHTVRLGALEESGISNVQSVVGNAAEGIVSTLEITGSGGGIWSFESGDSGKVALGTEEIQFSQFNQFWGGDGDDSFLISVSLAGPIDGRAGDDVFTLLAPALVAKLNGGTGDDTLGAYQEIGNNWILSSPGSVLQSAANNAAIQFSGIETLRGAENYADNFTILDDLEVQPTILAGDGDAVDAIDYSRLMDQSITVTLGEAGLTGFESVIGNSNHTLAGADEDSTWVLTADGGSVSWGNQATGFNGFGYWAGGSGDDSFDLQILGPGAPVGIDGGGGSDELDLSALESEIHVSLGDASGQFDLANLDLANIETLSANSLFANRLTSSAAQAEWTINNANAGILEENGTSSISFSGFHHLEGTQSTTFTLMGDGYLGGEASVGSVTGSAQTSALRVTGDGDHSWLLDAGVGTGSLWREGVQRLHFAALTNLQGGQGADEFVLTDAAASITNLDGGNGVNSLRAGFQKNVALEWSVVDGAGSVDEMVGEFLQISQLYGQVGVDVFNVSGTTQLELIDSGAGGDEIRLTDSSHVDFIFAGAGADTVAISDGATVEEPIDGGEGNDTLDLTNYATAVIWNVVEQRIGSFDYLDIEDFRAPAGFANTFQAPDGNNTWRITGVDSGQLETDGQVVTYRAIANLLGGSMEDLFVLTAEGSVSGEIDGGAGNNTLQGDDTGNQWTLSALDAGDLGNRVGAFERIGNLLGGTGNDSFNIEPGGVLSGMLDAGAGSDSLVSARQLQTWTLSGSAAGAIAANDGDAFLAFQNVEALQGSGEDTLLGSELDTNWTIDGEGAGSLVVGGANLTFTNFARVAGGEGNDRFTIVNDGALDGPIDGGGGSNDLIIQREGDLAVSLDPTRVIEVDDDVEVIGVLRVQNIEAINDDHNRLYGASDNTAGYDWIISGKNTGSVSPAGGDGSAVSFSNFSDLLGGERSDRFLVDTNGSLVGVDGGDGDDFLNYSGRKSNLEITIGRLGEGSNFTINNIEGLVGNDDGSGKNTWSATLIAGNGNNLWTLSEGDGEDAGQDGINDGVFVQQGGLRMVFRDFGHLRGGSGDDIFVLTGQGMLTGSIVDTGGSNNQLNLASIASGRSLRAVLLAAGDMADGSPDTLHIRGIQNLTGAGTATTLVGAESANQWQINGSDFGQITYEGNTVRFNNFGHLRGGGADDTFNVGPAGYLSGWLSGGNGEGSDSVEFNTSQAVSVWLAAPAAATGEGWWRLQPDVERVTANNSNPRNNDFRQESADAAIWEITGADEGAVGNTSFKGFGQLKGGGGDDLFRFTAGGRLSGLLDGGAGTNSVDLTSLSDAVRVAQGDREEVDLRIANIRQIDASQSTKALNYLWAADQMNTWNISSSDAGDINGLTHFTGFGNLTGGGADDLFKFSVDATLSGEIDGGAHDAGDTVDYESLTTALTIDLTKPVLYNVEQLIGNEMMSLQGPDMLSQWSFSGGKDQGVLAYEGGSQRLNFSKIKNVQGGNQTDRFYFSGGALITGGVHGGDGADEFFIEPGIGARQATWLNGGGGTDSLAFFGGGDGWSGTYGPNADGAPVFSFTAESSETPSFSIGYSGMESVVMGAALDRVTLKGTAEADTYRLSAGSWQWGDLLPVFYRDALQAITVASEDDDTVAITGPVAVTDELRLKGGALVVESGEPISARHLVLAGLHSAGTVDQPINTAVGELTLLNNLADVYVRETDDLVLGGITGEKAVNLRLSSGDLTQPEAEGPEAVIDTVGALTLIAERGSILLDRSDNLMAGLVTVSALNRVVLHNSSDTLLGSVKTRDFTVESAGDIHAQAAITAEGTSRLTSRGYINVSIEDNDLNDVSAQAARNIRLADRNALVLTNVESEVGDIVVVTKGAQGLGTLSAAQGEVSIDSGGRIVDLNGANTNIRAQRFLSRSVDGIGLTTDALELEVASLDVVNTRNEVVLSNIGPLTIERIHNGGDIALTNSTDVTFLKESVNAFHGTEDAQYPPIGERELPDYGGDFVLNIGIGNIKTDGSVVLAQPHIAAKTVTILNPHGVFLPPSPVIYAPERIKITSGRSRNRPYWALDVVPNDIEDDTKYYGDVVGAGEQLIEVESLADIDPAIFTPVRNYVYQDVSIRLPSDQLYEDEDE